MPDYGAPVINPQGGAGLEPALQATQLLSSIVGIGRQATALQSEKQTLQQRKGIAGIDWEKYDDGTGTVSTDKMLEDKELQQRAGDQFPEILHAAASIRGSQLQNRRSLVGLNSEALDQAGSLQGALLSDPDVLNDTPAGRAKSDAAWSRYAALGGDNARIAQLFSPVTQAAPPGKLARGIKAIQSQIGAAQQIQTQQPNFANNGANLINTNPSSAGGPLGGISAITNQLPPGIIQTQDAIGNSWVANQQKPGLAVPIGQGRDLSDGTQPPQGATPGKVDVGLTHSGADLQQQAAPLSTDEAINAAGQARVAANAQPSNAEVPPQKPPMAVANQPALNAHIAASQDAAAQYGSTADMIRRIQGLLKEAETGPGTDFIQKIKANPLINSKAGSSYQEIGAWLDRLAVLSAHSMGVPDTNAGLQTSQQFTGNTQQNNRVIRDKTLFANSLNEAANAYNIGLQKVLGASNSPYGPNYGAAQQFRTAWSKNFDPEVFALEHSFKTGDTEERDRILADVGKKNIPELLAKRKELMALTNGQIP